MKRINNRRILIILILSYLLCLHTTAQNKQYFDIWGGAGYSSLSHGIDNSKVPNGITIPGGLGYMLGGGYEYDVNQIIFLGGVEFMGLNSTTKLNAYSEDHVFVYPYIANYNITYHYAFKNYQEMHSLGYLNIPLQVGLKFSRYYALAGVKLGLNLSANYKVTSQLQITGVDPMLIDTLKNMPNHYLENTTKNDNGKLTVGASIAPSLEFGVVLDEWLNKNNGKNKNTMRSPLSYRAGVFINYGEIPLNTPQNATGLLTVPAGNPLIVNQPSIGSPSDVKVNGLLSSKLVTDKSLGSMLVGVKFTVLFDVTKEKSIPKQKAKPQPIPVFYAHVVDSKTKNNLQANLTLSSTSADHKTIFKKVTDKTSGMFSRELKAGKYQLYVSVPGYINYKNIIKHINSDTLLIALQPKPIPVPIPVFYARIVNAETKKNVVAEVTLNTATESKPILRKTTNKLTGMISQQVKAGKYMVNVTSDGYTNYQDTISHIKNDTLFINLRPKPVLYAHVVNADTKANLLAEVNISSTTDSKEAFKKLTDKITGLTNQMLLGGKYRVTVTAKGFIYSQDSINLSKTDTLLIALQPIKKETKVILHNLFFDYGLANIQPGSEPTLEELYQFLVKNPNVSIQIVGYTDSKGSVQFNQNLSQNRAKAVYTKLIEKGIDPSRLSWLGKGANSPIATNETDEGRALNRRVEIVIK